MSDGGKRERKKRRSAERHRKGNRDKGEENGGREGQKEAISALIPAHSTWLLIPPGCSSHLATLPPGYSPTWLPIPPGYSPTWPILTFGFRFPKFPNHYYDTLSSPNHTSAEVSGSPGLEAQLAWGSGGSESGPASPTGCRLQNSTQATWRKKKPGLHQSLTGQMQLCPVLQMPHPLRHPLKHQLL